MKQLFLIILLSLIWSCGSKNNSLTKADKKPINLEYVKKQLCYQDIFNKEDTIRCPDSIWTVQLKDTSLYLTQSYYGSGYANGIWINLIRLNSDSYTILDSVFCYWGDDLFQPKNIFYNDTTDWFYYVEEGSGLGHYSETMEILRVANDSFVHLLSIPLYVSDIEMDMIPIEYSSLEVSEIKFSKTKIVFKARFEAGVNKNDKAIPKRIKKDVATFEYSDSCKCFIWIKSSNKEFKKLWTGQKGYEWL